MGTYEDKMNKHLLTIFRNLVRNYERLLHILGDLLEFLLEVEFCLLDCALLELALGLELPNFFHL